MNLLGLATLTFLQAAMPGSATDPTEDTCYSQSEVIEYIHGQNPQARVVDTLSGAEAAEFVLAFNAEPPETEEVAEEVLIFERPPKPTHDAGDLFYVALFNDGCRTFAATVTKDVMLSIGEKLAGGI